MGLLQILMTLLAITFLVPTFWMVSSSLKVSTEVFAHLIVWWPAEPYWRNYVNAFQGHLPLGLFMKNTAVIVFFAVLGTLFSSSLVAYSFARIPWPGRNFWFGLLLGTMMLPDIVTMIPRFILFRTFRWYDTFLPLIVPYWGAVMALYVFLIRQFFLGIPMELEDAAYIDGASRIRILTQILMPLSRPVMATVAVFALLQHYNDFMNPLIYLRTMDKFPMSSRCRNNRGPGFGDGSRWVRGAGRDLASRGARRAGAGRHAGVHGVGAAGGPGESSVTRVKAAAGGAGA